MKILYNLSRTEGSTVVGTLVNNFYVQLKKKESAQLQSSLLHSCGGCGYTPTAHVLHSLRKVIMMSG